MPEPDAPDSASDPHGLVAAALGPYFAWEPWDPTAGWRPWAELADGDVAAERVGVARDTLLQMFGLAGDDVPVRVVASVTLLGWAARVVSPLLGAAVAGGALAAPQPTDLWWRPAAGGPLPMAYAQVQAQPCTGLDAPTLAAHLTRIAVVDLLGPVLETFRHRFALSPKVLGGNVASALAGAAGMIATTAPAYAGRAAAVVTRMLETPALLGTGRMVRPDPRQARSFLVRNNCCLYYRIPGGGTCGDCVLTPEDERRRHWRAALSAR